MGDGGVGAVEALRNFMNAGDAEFLCVLWGQVLHYDITGFQADNVGLQELTP